jgi:hypothetical protein
MYSFRLGGVLRRRILSAKAQKMLIFEQEKKMGPRIQSPASGPSSVSLKRKATTDEILVDDIAVSHIFGNSKMVNDLNNLNYLGHRKQLD